MKAEEVNALFERLVEEPPEDRFDLDALVRSGSRRRRGRFVGIAGLVAAATLVIAAPVVWLNLDEPQGMQEATPTDVVSQGSLPDHLEVRCTPKGVAVSAPEFTTQAAGAVVTMSTSMKPGGYLIYGSDAPNGISGGTRVPPDGKTWTMALAPGVISFSCDPPGRADPLEERTVRLTDQAGYWRNGSAADFGCPNGTQPSWNMGLTDSGPTAEAAVDAVLANFAEMPGGDPGRYTSEPMNVGYVDGVVQMWMGYEGGRAFATIRVVKTASGFDAGPETGCS